MTALEGVVHQLKQPQSPEDFRKLWASFLELKTVINTANEDRFFKMLEAAPELKQYWDIEERNCKQRSVGLALKRLPDHEAALLRFYGSVWFGNADLFGFDFIHSVKVMDEKAVKIVRKWLVSPFFC